MSWWFDITLLLAAFLLTYVAFKLNRQAYRSPGDIIAREMQLEAGTAFRFFPERLMRQCGIMPGDFRYAYWFVKVLLAILCPLIAAELGLTSWPWFLFAALSLVGYFLLDGLLFMNRSKRKKKIEQNLSYFVDLIVAFLHSGLTLSEAFERAAENGLPAKNPLSFEVKLISYELTAGLDRTRGFRNLADRTGVEALHRLAAVLDVGFRSGASIGEILKGQSELLRARQWEKGAELINRKSLEALLPMALVSIPMLIVLIFFPAAIQLIGALSLFRESFL